MIIRVGFFFLLFIYFNFKFTNFNFFLGQEQDSYLSDSSSHSKSRLSGAETSKLPQPNWTRNKSSEKNREESGPSKSPSLSSTTEEKPPTGRKLEEPKLVTIRSITPVAGVAFISETPKPQYPLKKIDSSDHTWWLQNAEQKEMNNEELTNVGIGFDVNMNSTLKSKIPSYSIRKMDSSDRNQWLEEADQPVNNEESLSCADSNSWSESTKSNSTSNNNRSYSIRKMDSSDRNRWLQEAVQEDNLNETLKTRASTISNSESIKSNTMSSPSSTDDIKRVESTSIIQCQRNDENQDTNIHHSMSRDNVSNADSRTSSSLSNINRTYSVRKMDSFDTPWWLKEENSSRASEDTKLSTNQTESTKSIQRYSAKSPEMTTSYGIRKMDSCDSLWWQSGDEAKQVSSLSDNSIKNHRIEENPENEETADLNQWWLNNGLESRSENDSPKFNGNLNVGENGNYLVSRKFEPWNNGDNYAAIKKMDSFESHSWEQDQRNADTRSTSISIDWSKDGLELSNQPKSTPADSLVKSIPGVRKMDSFDSPSWLASEESESQSHEPKQTSSCDVVSSSSKQMGELADSSPDWWGEKNESDDFVRTKRTSLRIKKIENVVNETVEEPIYNNRKEANLQDELDQLMLFIGGCRNIDELLGNEEPPPAAPTTPPDTDSGNVILFLFL